MLQITLNIFFIGAGLFACASLAHSAAGLLLRWQGAPHA